MVHYTIAHARPWTAADAEALVRTAHRRAAALVRRRRLAQIGPVESVADSERLTAAVAFERDGDDTLCHDVPARQGWLFSVWPGEGCESANFGLCLYPARVRAGRRWIRTGGGGWTWSDFCKTQYASRHGAEHFLRCHRAVIDLVLIWERLGCRFRIQDEGDYWPGRDEAKLLANVGLLNRVMAGLAGTLKDSADERGGKIEAPILAHPRFEQLEAEGVAAHGRALRQAGALLLHLGHDV